jgi:hypothetical protein
MRIQVKAFRAWKGWAPYSHRVRTLAASVSERVGNLRAAITLERMQTCAAQSQMCAAYKTAKLLTACKHLVPMLQVGCI